MKIKTVRKWSEEPKEDKGNNILALFLAALMLGCYIYIGHLITLL